MQSTWRQSLLDSLRVSEELAENLQSPERVFTLSPLLSAKNQPPDKIQNSLCRVLPIFLLGNYAGVLRVRIFADKRPPLFSFFRFVGAEGAEHNCSSVGERGTRIQSIFHAPQKTERELGPKRNCCIRTGAKELLGLGLLSLCIGVVLL